MSQTKKAQTKQKSRGITARIIALACAGVLVIAGVAIALKQLTRKTGEQLRATTALETEHFQVNNAMLSYCIDKTYRNYIEQNQGNANARRPIRGRSFKKQQYTDGQTWFDYLVTASVYTLSKTLKMCEAAYAAGYNLSAEQIAACESEAASVDLSDYNNEVNTQDVVDVLKLKKLATDYEAYAKANIEVTQEALDAYFSAHGSDSMQFTVLCCSVAWTDGSDTDTGTGLTRADAEQAWEKLLDAKSPEAFRTVMRDFLTNMRGKDEATTEAMVKAAQMQLTGDQCVPEVAAWAADAGTNLHDTFALTNEKQCYTQVYMLTAEPTIDQGDTVDLRMIQLNKGSSTSDVEARAAAEQILADWRAAGGTEEQFATYAQNNSANFAAYQSGGLFLGFSENDLTFGNDLHDWAFDSARQPGETEILETDSSVIIVYYVADNPLPADEAAAYRVLYQEQYDAISTSGDRYAITEHKDVYDDLTF